MKNNIFKTFISGLAFVVAICPQAFAGDTGSCGDNCWYTYKDGTLTYSVKDWDNPNGRAISIVNTQYKLSGSVTNVIVAEGIEEIKFDSKNNAHTIQSVGAPNGKFVLPSTLKNFANGTGWNLNFGTIEINSSDLSIGYQTIAYNNLTPLTLVVPNSNSITFSDKTFYKWSGDYLAPGSLTIVCKSGTPEDCRQSFGNSLTGNRLGNKVMFTNELYDENGKLALKYYDNGYYKYDSDGNIIEQWNFDNTEQYDTKGNIIAKYGDNGNLLSSYSYNSDGSVGIYDANGKLTGLKNAKYITPAQAAELTKPGKNNTVTLTFK